VQSRLVYSASKFSNFNYYFKGRCEIHHFQYSFASQAVLDLGTDRFGFGFGGTGKKSNNRQFDDYGEAFGKSDVIGVCIDLDSAEITFMKNGANLGVAFKIPSQLLKDTFYPAVVLKNAEILFNFGDEAFKHPPPPGYIAISKAPNPKINTVASAKSSNTAPMKIINNAPQAIIIEVNIYFLILFKILNITKLLKLTFSSHLENWQSKH